MADQRDQHHDELKLEYDRKGRNGTIELKAKIGGKVEFSDVIDVSKDADRRRFIRALTKTHSGIEPETIDRALIDIVNELDRRTDGHDGSRSARAAGHEMYEVVDGMLCR